MGVWNELLKSFESSRAPRKVLFLLGMCKNSVFFFGIEKLTLSKVDHQQLRIN